MASAASAPPQPTSPGSLKRIVAASLIGTTIEWYDNSSDQSYGLLFLVIDPRKSAPNQHREVSCWVRNEDVPSRPPPPSREEDGHGL